MLRSRLKAQAVPSASLLSALLMDQPSGDPVHDGVHPVAALQSFKTASGSQRELLGPTRYPQSPRTGRFMGSSSHQLQRL
jgi:hypothetical protein